MSARDQYLARAEACAEDARTSNLENVRERNLRSEAVWRSMAERELRVQKEREQKEIDVAARLEATAPASAEASA